MSIRRIRAFYGLLDLVQRRSVVQRFDAAVERQRGSRADLERYAAERLREVLERARRDVPFYAERLGRVAGSAEDLAGAAFAAIPPLEKAAIAEAGDRLLARGGRLGAPGVQVVTSGGTTGPATRIALDAAAADAHAGAALRTFLWWDADPTRSHAMLWGCPPEENTYLSRSGRLKGRILGRTLLETYGLDAAGARRHYEALRAKPLDHVAGYSSALVRVAAFAPLGATPRIRAGVAAAAEPIFDFQRPAIERAFGAPLFDRYGCNEFSAIAHACRAGRLHVGIDRVRIDLVREDGSPAAHGEIGRVLVT
ncbi:MAG TPA: hypothetical protein VNE71_00070, partial [Myxococcota bacterium]|nr:hypothetical protein [Myxococcota bacterium]